MIPLRTNIWDAPCGTRTPQEGDSSEPTEAHYGSSLLGHDESLPLAHTVRTPTTTDAQRQMRRAASSAEIGGNKYGTFHEAQRKAAASNGSVKNRLGPRLLDPRDVTVRYFNSRGKVGETFASVQLKPEDMKEPVAQMCSFHGVQHRPGECSRGSSSRAKSHEDLPRLSAEEKRLWEQLSDRSSRSTNTSHVELHLNWHFVEVVGRDEHNKRRRYDAVLKQLTKEFGICPSFLVEREHTLVLPQILESHDNPNQYLICLRVATEKISTTDDNIVELTNRWLMVVDLNKKLVVVLHRLDCESMANLRLHWTSVMESHDISFEEFLLKLMDDAVDTFSVSLDAHASLLDICEAKLLLTSKSDAASKQNAGGFFSLTDPHCELTRQTYQKVLNHFDNASRSEFLTQLLDTRRVRIDKSEMNSFLYHLHRRSSVQHRVLLNTQAILGKCYTRLRLCSKQHMTQMCSYCIELAAKAQEIRDDSQHLLDMHISLQSFRTNELMAVLTRVSVVFTPWAFLAGVYGMNFMWIPELHFQYGYVYFWMLCFLVAGVMQWYFYRRGLF